MRYSLYFSQYDRALDENEMLRRELDEYEESVSEYEVLDPNQFFTDEELAEQYMEARSMEIAMGLRDGKNDSYDDELNGEFRAFFSISEDDYLVEGWEDNISSVGLLMARNLNGPNGHPNNGPAHQRQSGASSVSSSVSSDSADSSDKRASTLSGANSPVHPTPTEYGAEDESGNSSSPIDLTAESEVPIKRLFPESLSSPLRDATRTESTFIDMEKPSKPKSHSQRASNSSRKSDLFENPMFEKYTANLFKESFEAILPDSKMKPETPKNIIDALQFHAHRNSGSSRKSNASAISDNKGFKTPEKLTPWNKPHKKRNSDVSNESSGSNKPMNHSTQNDTDDIVIRPMKLTKNWNVHTLQGEQDMTRALNSDLATKPYALNIYNVPSNSNVQRRSDQKPETKQ